jgi:hypothetical protein
MTLHPADETGAQQAPSISLNRALNQPKHESKVSIATKNSVASTRSHKEYLDTLIPPTQEMLQKIATAQEHKEEEVIMKRLSADHPRLSEEDRKRAAVALIQRSYRGHRERRMLDGMTLDPSTRWVEAVKEARYRRITEPRARASCGDDERGAFHCCQAELEENWPYCEEGWRRRGFRYGERGREQCNGRRTRGSSKKKIGRETAETESGEDDGSAIFPRDGGSQTSIWE